ncbi:phage tail spike protein [Mesobacillus stamsii]|uniref:Phage minor structural protein n=1 Tax=Mesobacillus stamsii TaxID=225347 RepID=A0ABU0FWN0_9BACI|nr:phage tail spike protein [Mesobacillus stamsii]MDQ0414240.1 phage minor structural protein [Mesobacillus stamsii]
MSELLIFDQYDNLLAILSNDAEEACPFWDAPFKELLNKGSEFQATVPANHEDAQHIMVENQIAFTDKDGAFRLFIIREIEQSNGANGPEITAICEPAMLELNDEIIEDVRPYNTSINDALTNALVGTRWLVGQTADFGINSTNFYYITATEAITKIINTWGGELRDRVEVTDNKITGRYIDILPRRGADTGKIWDIDKDIINITHKIQSYPKTALYGMGSSTETDAGGFSRKITFADVVWSVANGDPTDKPSGKEWVGDQEALALYGRKNTDGTYRHRIGIYENGQQEDAAKLLQETWESLQKQKYPLENYEMDVFLLEEISGYEHEKVRLGDTSIAIDRSFSNPIEIEARVIVFEYDVADPDNTGTVELGDYIDLYTDDNRLDAIESRLNDKSGIWDKVELPVTDDDIENIIPDAPTNVTATGLFQNIMLEWDFNKALYIANYEVYASQILGFTPDISNLVWKGKTSAYTHKVGTNQQWYFRVRAVNTHGLSGPFSIEVNANTAHIITDDILFGAVNADKLADLAVTAGKLADSSVTAAKIANLAVGNAAIANAAITNAKIANLAVGTAQIQDLAITTAKIGNLAVDNAKIADLSVTNAKIADLAVTNAKIDSLDGNKITAYTITADKLYVNSLDAISANLGTVIAGTITSNTTIDVGTNMSIGQKLILKYNSSVQSQIVFPDSFGAETWRIYKDPNSEDLVISGWTLRFNIASYFFIGGFDEAYYYKAATGNYDGGWHTGRGEQGFCGIGAIAGSSTTGAVAGTGVNFKMRKNYTPSSVSLSTSSSTASGLVTDIRTDGFWLYVEGNGTSTAYRYWRGYYLA